MRWLVAAILLCLASLPAAAQGDDRYPSWENRMTGRPILSHERRSHASSRRAVIVRSGDRGQVIGGRPAGCPHRFCGCALSLHIFGRIVPSLNLAANWRSFPRAAPASGMVAARSGHVFKLIAHVEGNTWRVWDANSGRGRIRIHNRSIAGHAIVNPHGRRMS